MSVQFEEHVADQHARRRRRAAGRHADDEQRLVAADRVALVLGKARRLAGDAEVAALEAAVFEDRGRRLPGDRRGYDDAEAANGRRGRRRQAARPPCR